MNNQQELPPVIKTLIRDLISTPDASDAFLIAGAPPTLRVMRKLVRLKGETLCADAIQQALPDLLGPEEAERLKREKSLDLGLELNGDRFRVAVYYQKDSPAICIRRFYTNIPPLNSLGFELARLKPLINRRTGLILVTGPTGSGKTTTLASIIDHFNQSRTYHVITIEDPIEYMHNHAQSLISQRELNRDTPSFAKGLKDALRESPDVILVGELRDNETAEVALRAAETGHLVITTLHTLGAQHSILRLVNSFQADLRDMARTQLAACLAGVISQTLIPTTEGKLRLIYEILEGTLPLANIIRSGQEQMILNEMVNNQHSPTINEQLDQLCFQTLITPEQAIRHSPDPRGLKVYR